MPTNRISTLIAAIRGNLAELEAEMAGSEVVHDHDVEGATDAGWTNGMSQPDKFGRVKLQAVEAFRQARGAEFLAANRPIPEWYFVQEALTTFKLNDFQRYHITRNIGDNANFGYAGNWQSGVKFERREDGSMVEVGRFTSEDPDGNTMSTKGPTAAQAAQEVIDANEKAIAYERNFGAPDNPEFSPGRG